MSNHKKPSIADQLNRPHLVSNNAQQDSISPPDPAVPTRIRITLDQLIPYSRNPRQSDNPLYDEIKESIRNRGLDHAPNVTRRNPADSYMIRDGGNTRLKILKELWEETGDQRFYILDCMFHPWQSDLHSLIGHMVENEMKGGTLFIERAIAAHDIRQELTQNSGEEISIRELSRQITALGWTVNQSNLGQMLYAYEHLFPFIPKAFWSGIGIDRVKKIRKLLENSRKFWESVATPEESIFDAIWQPAFTALDGDSFDVDNAEQELCYAMAKILGCSHLSVAAEVQGIAEGISDGGRRPTSPLANLGNTPPALPRPAPAPPPRNPASPGSQEHTPPLQQPAAPIVGEQPGYTHTTGSQVYNQEPARIVEGGNLPPLNTQSFQGQHYPLDDIEPGSPMLYRDLLYHDSMSLKEQALDAAMTYAHHTGIGHFVQSVTRQRGRHLGYQMRTDIKPADHQLIHWLFLHTYSNLFDEDNRTTLFLDEYTQVAEGSVPTHLEYHSYMLITLFYLRSNAMAQAIRQGGPAWTEIWKAITTLEVITGILQTRSTEEAAELDAGLDDEYDNETGAQGGV